MPSNRKSKIKNQKFLAHAPCERWTAFIERRRRAILLGSLALTLGAALSLFEMRLDFDVLEMLPTGAPAFDNFKVFVAEFGELDQLVVLVEGSDPTAARSFAESFAGRLRDLDSVERVHVRLDIGSIEEELLGRHLYNYLPAEAYAELAARLTPAAIDAQVALNQALLRAPLDLSAARRVQRDPLGLTPLAARSLAATFDDPMLNVRDGFVATPDGMAILMFVQPIASAFDIPFTTRFMEQVREAERASATELGASILVGYTGSYAFALEDAATIRWDVARYSVLALAGVLVIFLAGYRNLRILPFVTYPLIVTALLTSAVSLLLYARLNAVSLSFAAILYGLSIDSAIHYFTRLSQEVKQHDLRRAVANTLSALGSANVVAAGTTAAVFVVIGFSQLAGVSQLGVLTAVGMLINIGQFFLLYPALSFSVGPRALNTKGLDTPRLAAAAAACGRQARWVAVASAVAAALLLIPAGGVGLDVELTRLRPARSAAAEVQAEIEARFGAHGAPGAVLVRGETLEEALQRAERVDSHLRAYRDLGVVESARGVTALLPPARTQRQRLAMQEALPRQQILNDLRVALARHGFRTEPFAPFFEDFARPRQEIIGWNHSALQPLEPVLARHVRERDGRFIIATYVQPAPGVSLATVAERLQGDAADVPLMVAGRVLLQEELAHMLRRELAGFFLAAFGLNFLIIALHFRHLGTSLAILLPQALVIICCLALMDLSGIGIGPVNLVVIPLVLGIGVDHCVYLAERWQRGADIGAAVRHGGRALAVSGLTTAAGFGLLGLSRYPALAEMGMFTAASLLVCLAAAVTLFPALLALLAPAATSRQEMSE